MTTTPISPIEPHSVHSERLLAHAREMIEKGDRLQASEKIWGAVVHAIKAVARERGWSFSKHRGFNEVVRHLAEAAGEDKLAMNRLYRSVDSFHTNFYGDTKEPAELEEGLEDAQELIRLLHRADERAPRNLPAPLGVNRRGGGR